MDYDSWDSYDREDRNGLSNTEARVNALGEMTIHQSNLIAAGAPIGAGVDIQLGAKGTFGGKDSGISFGGNCKIYSDNGNYIQGDIQSDKHGVGEWHINTGQNYEFNKHSSPQANSQEKKSKCKEKK